MNQDQIINWLLSGDVSVRWQVMQDLLQEHKKRVKKEREKVALVGWGKRLLSFQGEDGRWSGSLYNGKWVSTTYCLLLLKELGMLPNNNSERACRQLFLGGLFNDEEIRFSSKQKIRDNGVTGLVLGLLCYFEHKDNRLHNIAEFLVRSQNGDGSWFFDDKLGAEKYSFENTMIVLKALFEYQKRYPNYANKVVNAQKSGQEFLLKHYLFKNPVSGEVINRKWLRFSFPFYWFYDILVALDYFQQTNTKDPRLQPAIQIMQNKKTPNNIWKLENKHNGKTYFTMEQIGQPSKWNTLRCLRVTKWWESKNNSM